MRRDARIAASQQTPKGSATIVDAPDLFSFSTDDFPERERVAAWRETFGGTIAKLDMEPLGEQPFHGRSLVRVLPDLTLGSIVSAPIRITRTHRLGGRWQ